MVRERQSKETMAARITDLERRLKVLERASSLGSASIGSGGLRVYDEARGGR